MTGFQVSLYKALRDIKITHETADQVVAATESYVVTKISEAIKPLQAEINALRWQLATIGTVIAISSIASGIVVALK